MSTTFAYCRVSTTDQDTTIQEDAIRLRYPDAVIRTEKASATSRNGRPVLELLLEMISAGDQLVVWKLDRLARNMLDLCAIVEDLRGKGASLVILDQNIDTGTAAGKAFLQMLGVFAEFETNLRRERQLAGIAKAKDAGKYKGRKPVMDGDRIKAMLTDGLSHAAIAKELGCSTKTVQRVRQGMG
jgi:DNA invertase Pin-like site-specific DNA recombinase